GDGHAGASMRAGTVAAIQSCVLPTDAVGNPATTTGNAVALDTDKTETATLVVADTADHVINAAESTAVSFTVGGLDEAGTGTVRSEERREGKDGNDPGEGTYSANVQC